MLTLRQGEPVSIDYPIVKAYRRKVTLRNDYRVFPTAVIVSYADKNQLPLVLDGSESYPILHIFLENSLDN